MLPVPTRRRTRPDVVDAQGLALIPLRPLTIGEVLDAAFLIVQRNGRSMLGLPALLGVLVATAGALCMGLYALGATYGDPETAALLVGFGVFLLVLALFPVVVWMDAVLTRVSLQTALGDGFAPSATKVTLRSSLPLFWSMVAFSLLALVAAWVASAVVSVLNLFTLPLLLSDERTTTWVLATVSQLLVLLLTWWVLSYLALAVPAFTLETENAPGWVGKPETPTGVVGGFTRSVALIGLRQALRATMVTGAVSVVCTLAVAMMLAGSTLLCWLFITAMEWDPQALLLSPYASAGLIIFSVSLTLAAVLAFAAAAQTVFYLDLRMRREALDLALRFNCVDVPQPSVPAPTVWRPPFPQQLHHPQPYPPQQYPPQRPGPAA